MSRIFRHCINEKWLNFNPRGNPITDREKREKYLVFSASATVALCVCALVPWQACLNRSSPPHYLVLPLYSRAYVLTDSRSTAPHRLTTATSVSTPHPPSPKLFFFYQGTNVYRDTALLDLKKIHTNPIRTQTAYIMVSASTWVLFGHRPPKVRSHLTTS